MADAPLLSELRSIEDLNPDPFVEFKRWFEAAKSQGGSKPEIMALATATPDGIPSVRIVILRGFDARGWVFYTSYESRKGEEIAANPAAALVFYWDGIDRQVRVEGTIAKTTQEESERYFQSRPLDSRLEAWTSRQSRVIASRQVLENRMAELRAQYPDGNIPLPPYWGGYRLVPSRIEFWVNRPNRLHDRFCYTKRTATEWDIVRLSP